MDAERDARPADDAQRQKAITRAHMVLAARACTEHELRTKLLAAPFEPQLVDWVIEQFASAGLINDESYATLFVQSRVRRGFGARRIQQDLSKRGIDRELARAALDEHLDAELATDSCAQQVRRRYDAAQLQDRAVRAKATRWLAGRGYDMSTIDRAIRCVRDEIEADS